MLPGLVEEYEGKREANSNMKEPEIKVHLPSAHPTSLDHASRKIHTDIYVEIGEK